MTGMVVAVACGLSSWGTVTILFMAAVAGFSLGTGLFMLELFYYFCCEVLDDMVLTVEPSPRYLFIIDREAPGTYWEDNQRYL